MTDIRSGPACAKISRRYCEHVEIACCRSRCQTQKYRAKDATTRTLLPILQSHFVEEANLLIDLWALSIAISSRMNMSFSSSFISFDFSDHHFTCDPYTPAHAVNSRFAVNPISMAVDSEPSVVAASAIEWISAGLLRTLGGLMPAPASSLRPVEVRRYWTMSPRTSRPQNSHRLLPCLYQLRCGPQCRP